jgi:hypothetical protein
MRLARRVTAMKGEKSWKELAGIIGFVTGQRVSSEALRLAAAGKGGTSVERVVAAYGGEPGFQETGSLAVPKKLTKDDRISLAQDPSSEVGRGRWARVPDEDLRWELSAAATAGVPIAVVDLASDLLVRSGLEVEGTTPREKVQLALEKAQDAVAGYQAAAARAGSTTRTVGQGLAALRVQADAAAARAARRGKKKPRGRRNKPPGKPKP